MSWSGAGYPRRHADLSCSCAGSVLSADIISSAQQIYTTTPFLTLTPPLMMMPMMTPNRPSALPKISTTRIFTKSVEFCASDKAQLLPTMPTHMLQASNSSRACLSVMSEQVTRNWQHAHARMPFCTALRAQKQQAWGCMLSRANAHGVFRPCMLVEGLRGSGNDT